MLASQGPCPVHLEKPFLLKKGNGNMDLFEIAKKYTSRGWYVLSVHGIRQSDQLCTCGKTNCPNSGKHPNSPQGCKDATLEESTIRQFCQFKFGNIGIATGQRSGICILDVDPRHGGDKSLAELEQEFSPLPHTVKSRTGHEGGMHFYFKYPQSGLGNKAGFRAGLDIRGEGGYVVAPPSRHMSGRIYEWDPTCHPDNTAIAEMPAWLLMVVQSKGIKTRQNNSKIEVWNEGCRNDNLFRYACSLSNKGAEVAAILKQSLVVNLLQCNPPLSEAEVKKVVESVKNYNLSKSIAEEINWLPRKSLPPLEVEVPQLLEEMIPLPILPWVVDITERMQSSLEMLMAPIIVILSGLIGRRLAIKPKQKDDWKIVPNLWGGIVAPPSAMKTPAMNEALKQIRKLELISKTKFDLEMNEYLAKCEADKKYNGPMPIRRRRLVNDSTIEKLGELLNQNPNGLVVFRDELYGFLKSMEKPGRESDRQFYLESFNGDGAFVTDRIARGTIDVQALCLSILGGIQPDRLSSYFSETVKNGSSDDGFLTRFQVMVYPPKTKNWELVDRYPNAAAIDRAFKIINRIDEIDFLAEGFEQGEYDEMPVARFDDEAQQYFYKWLTRLEGRLRSGEIESLAFEAHLTKYKKLMPSIALIFHIINFCDEERTMKAQVRVDLRSAQLAAAWCDFLEEHAKKIYADALRPQICAAYAFIKKVESGEITDRFSFRGLYRKGWSQLADHKVLRSALGILESHHWIKLIEESPSGKGAPCEVIYLHPDLIKGGSDE